MDAISSTKANFEGNAGNFDTQSSHGENYVSPQNQSDMGRALNRQRRQSGGNNVNTKQALGDLAKAATGPQKELVRQAFKFAFNMAKQVDAARDWPYLFILIPMAALKDIVDIAFAAIPGVGMVVSFIFTILIAILTATFLILITGKFTTKRAMLNIAGPLIQFFTEAFPGIGWLPLCFVETVLIYLIVLGQRAFASEGQPEASDQPEPQYTDGYSQQEAA